MGSQTDIVRASIMSVYCNGRDTIGDKIESILARVYEDIEYVIADSFSTEGTYDILAQYRGTGSRSGACREL
jgi:hypothetical protein